MTSSYLSLLKEAARRHGERLALRDGERRIDHARRLEVAARLAGGLRALGLSRGDRLALLAANGADAMALLDAAAWLGVISVPLNTRLADAELDAILADCAPAVIAAEPRWHGRGDAAARRIALGPADALRQMQGSPVDAADPDDDAPLLLVYTAALDGRPRGAILTHGNLAASAAQLGQAWSLGAGDAALGVLPHFHAAGLALHAAVLADGGAVVLQSKYDPMAAAHAIHDGQVTVMGSFAPMMEQLLDAAAADGLQLGALRIVFGLEPPAVIERLAAAAPHATFHASYGQTETGGPIATLAWREAPGCAGRAMAASELRIVDDLGVPLPPGRVGRIAVRGPTVSPGYWPGPSAGRTPEGASGEASAADSTTPPPRSAGPGAVRGGQHWHDTGDLGLLDEAGRLWFRGQAPGRRLVKSGGENVYPAEIEQVLRRHPDVADALVFGVPDARWGEAVAALCTARPGAIPAPEALVDHVAASVARYKRPRHLAVVDALPFDAKGTPDLARARDMLGR